MEGVKEGAGCVGERPAEVAEVRHTMIFCTAAMRVLGWQCLRGQLPTCSSQDIGSTA